MRNLILKNKVWKDFVVEEEVWDKAQILELFGNDPDNLVMQLMGVIEELEDDITKLEYRPCPDLIGAVVTIEPISLDFNIPVDGKANYRVKGRVVEVELEPKNLPTPEELKECVRQHVEQSVAAVAKIPLTKERL